VKYEVKLTFEVDDEREGQRRLDAIAAKAGAEIESLTMSTEGAVGQAILVPQDEFAAADTDVRSVPMSRQDAEVCDKALTVVLNWWIAASSLGLVPDEGTQEQLHVFPFQRLTLLAERYEGLGTSQSRR
jgi:hypothetical protein